MKTENRKIAILNYKNKVWFYVGNFLMFLYSFTRNCTGVKQSTDAKLREYKQNEVSIEAIGEKIPVIKHGVNELIASNNHLENCLNAVIDDLEDIDYLLKKNDIKAIKTILAQYPFTNMIRGEV